MTDGRASSTVEGMLGVQPLRAAIVDWGLALVLFGSAVYQVWIGTAAGSDSRWLVTLFLAAALLPLAWRRRAPLAVLLVVLATIAAHSAWLDEWASFQYFAALVLAVFSVAAYAEGRRAAVGVAIATALVVIGSVA